MHALVQRTVKRVPTDFTWPLRKPWEGYRLPERLRGQECWQCGGSGVTSAMRWVRQIAALLLMLNWDLSHQARGESMHPYFTHTGSYADERPSPDIAELTTGLAGRGGPGQFHDEIDLQNATRKVIEAAGLDPTEWGVCPPCSGHGSVESYPGQRLEATAWEPYEPPPGDGWQMWETVSEGSPVSPVFATVQGLATWCAAHVTPFGDEMWWSAEQWLEFIHTGMPVTVDPDDQRVPF